jgi:N-sulfoglucosamine sulfohydrolase
MCYLRGAALIMVAVLLRPAPAAERPNLVVFIADDLGQRETAPYGAKDVQTRHMTRLAQAGLRFTHAFVASPSCAPSRAALLTGAMPAINGAEANHSRPHAEIKKLPDYLHELGYEVVAFGKVAHYGHGSQYGFDLVSHEGFQNYESIPAAAEYLKTRKSVRPLCLLVGTHWPHVPWPHEAGEYEPAKVELPPTHVDTTETRLWRTRYYAAIGKADDDLGTIYAAAREHLDPANTFFFFTSDHGGQWPFGKWNLYDAGIRVPLIVEGPGIQAAVATDALVSWVDLLPTLIELGGGTPPAEIDGRSFAGVLLGKTDKHRDEIFATHSGDGQFNVYPIRAVRDGRWKYILNLHSEFQHATHINRAAAGDGLEYFRSWEAAAKTDERAAAIVKRYRHRPKEELYDLEADPHELTNLADEPGQADRLAEMRAKVAAWMERQKDRGTVFGKPLLAGQEATPIAPAAKSKGKKGKTQNKAVP